MAQETREERKRDLPRNQRGVLRRNVGKAQPSASDADLMVFL